MDFEGDDDFYEGNIDVRDNGGTLLASSSADAEPASWAPARAAKVQLVACVTLQFTTKRLGTCRYKELGSTKANRDVLDSAQYTVSLFVARTGRKLAGPVTVTGTDRTCPASILGFGTDRNPPVYTSLGRRQIKALLGRYVR